MHQIFTPFLTPFWCQQTKPDENRQNVIFYDERKYVEIKVFMKPDEARQKSISAKKLMEILKNPRNPLTFLFFCGIIPSLTVKQQKIL